MGCCGGEAPNHTNVQEQDEETTQETIQMSEEENEDQ